MRRIILYTTALLLFVSHPTTAWDQQNLDLSLRMATVDKAGPPELFFRTLLFTYDEYRYARYVGIAFDFEDYQKIHPFKRNEHGVYIYPYDIPGEPQAIQYRLVVDGLWMPDPNSGLLVFDKRGNKLSRFEFELPEQRVYTSPMISKTGVVKFYFRHTPGKRVFVSGDFNNWEPFMLEMRESEPGTYVYEESMIPGRYEYYYIVDGSRVIDPLNPDTGADSHGNLASRFAVP